tara:strand:- start:155 stop:364 length:210 start_codon:yes stop_codon:yes gene_type:complete
MNILKKFFQIFYPKDLSKQKSLDNFDHNLESCEGLLKELSPFYFEENNNFDESTMEILIKLKKIEKRRD